MTFCDDGCFLGRWSDHDNGTTDIRKLLKNALVLVASIALAFGAARLPLFDYLNYLVQDSLVRAAAPPVMGDDILIVGVDEETLEAFPEPIVMWHKYMAGVIDGARVGGARAMGMDLIPAISLDWLDRGLDLALFKALRKAGSAGVPVVLGYDSGEEGQIPHRKFMMAAAGLGYLNLWPDRDGAVRSYHLVSEGRGDKPLESLVAALLARTGNHYDAEATPYVDYRHTPFPVVSMAEVFRRQQAGDENWLKEQLGNKILLVGVTTRKLHDHHVAPVSRATAGEDWIYGVMIHGLVLEATLSGHNVHFVDDWVVQTLVGVIGAIAGLLFLLLPPARAGGSMLVLGVCVGAGVFYAFRQDLLIPAAPLIVAVVLPAMVAGLYRYVVEYWQFRRLQRYFKSYVSPDVMREIIDRRGDVALGGSNVTATVMFTDIRNFTTLSERMPPSVVVTGLNRYFEAMTHAVINNGGYLNRYLGDGILAIFGAPNPLEKDGAVAAVTAAFDMQRLLGELNGTGLFPGVDEIRIGIGIHSGEAIVGNIGCAEKMDYSIIGDTVNLASRIESKTKEFHAPILVSESTRERIGDTYHVEFVDSVHVKGREQAVNLYRVFEKSE